LKLGARLKRYVLLAPLSSISRYGFAYDHPDVPPKVQEFCVAIAPGVTAPVGETAISWMRTDTPPCGA
jgi:hypothetical protein